MADWQPIATAPRDGTYILAQMGTIGSKSWSYLSSRCFVIRHEGKTDSDYDLGWSLFPGFGGAPDHWIVHWHPLPAAEAA